MADFLDEKLKEIQARLRELRPLVEEFHRLEAAEQALSGVSGLAPAAAPSPAPARRGRGGGGGSGGGGGGGRPSGNGRGRPRGTGTRGAEALELVRTRPGITIPELAEGMGIKQNYLYRVMPSLVEQGLVVKSGRGWHLRQIESGGSAAVADDADVDEAPSPDGAAAEE